LTNSKEISTVKDGIKQLLDERRKSNPDVTPDVFLAVTRSLVAAADARQIEFSKAAIATQQARTKIDTLKTAEEKKAVTAELEKFKASLADETILRLSEDYEKGSVLAFYFSDQLKGTENSGFDIASSVREMILSLDATKETSRLEQFAGVRKRALAAREERKNKPESTSMIVDNPVTNRLLEIQKLIDTKNYVQADSELKLLQKTNPNEPRIFYNLGRVASLSAESITDTETQNKKLIEAKNDYENVLRSATNQTDPALVSLSYVALAKIYEFYDQKEYALKIYDAAIKVGRVANGAFDEAVAAKQRLMKNP
jgi:tetratricopeptide (TPR) repeat protein